MAERFIVKIQQALGGARMCLIYNQERTLEYQTDAEEVFVIMGDEPKKFFWAHINSQSKLMIEEEAEWQVW